MHMHKIAESGFMYFISDICFGYLGYLRMGEERMLGKRGFKLITLVEGEEW